MDLFYAIAILAGAVGLGALAIWAAHADMHDEQVAQKQAQGRVLAEAQAVATAADEALTGPEQWALVDLRGHEDVVDEQDDEESPVMVEIEQIAAAAWERGVA